MLLRAFSLTFLTICAAFDLRTGRIPNILTAGGLLISLGINLYEKGVSHLPGFFLSALLPVLMLFIVFFIRGIGAGDIKVFSVLSTTLEKEELLTVIILSFLIGGACSLHKIFRNRQALQRMGLLRAYAARCLSERKILPYETIEGGESYIPFSPCILAGYILSVFITR